MQRRGRRTCRRMKLFDSAQGAFIKYHYFPRTHVLTLQREISHKYFKKKEKQKRRRNHRSSFSRTFTSGVRGAGWHQEYFDGRWAGHRAPCQRGLHEPEMPERWLSARTSCLPDRGGSGPPSAWSLTQTGIGRVRQKSSQILHVDS